MSAGARSPSGGESHIFRSRPGLRRCETFQISDGNRPRCTSRVFSWTIVEITSIMTTFRRRFDDPTRFRRVSTDVSVGETNPNVSFWGKMNETAKRRQVHTRSQSARWSAVRSVGGKDDDGRNRAAAAAAAGRGPNTFFAKAVGSAGKRGRSARTITTTTTTTTTRRSSSSSSAVQIRRRRRRPRALNRSAEQARQDLRYKRGEAMNNTTNTTTNTLGPRKKASFRVDSADIDRFGNP